MRGQPHGKADVLADTLTRKHILQRLTQYHRRHFVITKLLFRHAADAYELAIDIAYAQRTLLPL